MWHTLWALLAVIATALCDITHFDFPQPQLTLSQDVRNYLNSFSEDQWNQFVTHGTNSVEREKRMENILLANGITVQNGSLSHVQLLDSLPNQKSNQDSDIALKILTASLYVYNAKCAPQGIDGDDCRTFLEGKSLPESSELGSECKKLLQSQRDGHHVFRRLLPPQYMDGFHELFTEQLLPEPWSASRALFQPDSTRSVKKVSEDDIRNLVLVQWAQFVEHDLSKPVSSSMSNGSPIDCCDRHQKKLAPRHHHSACAPILSREPYKYGRQSCLNYVRSALAVGSKCNFGAAEQLNQATASLDLSQLYGFTAAAEREMRTLKNGLLKSASTAAIQKDLLPMTTDENGHSFCARNVSNENVSTCFMAGDSRVNNSPLSILIYTIFMRNHNRIAAELRSQHSTWSDEELFHAAKAINVDIYRRIVMDEWLPIILGANLAKAVLDTPRSGQAEDYEVSNEFGVAAMRFYFSMLPNVLQNFATKADKGITNNNVQPLTNLFDLKTELYKPQLQYTAKKLDDILQSLLQQRAMKMDASYVGALAWPDVGDAQPTHADMLAFDIQRGRDHGLQPYFKYLEACNNVRITGWKDMEKFITKDHIDKLKNIYEDWTKVDLIVGGISERITEGTVGPTFSCILAEQFAKIHQRHRQQSQSSSLLRSYSSINGSQLLCLNSQVKAVPQNIFQLPSDSNRLIECGRVV